MPDSSHYGGNGKIKDPVPRKYQVGKIVQRVKALAAKADDLSPIPRTHMVEEENQFL